MLAGRISKYSMLAVASGGGATENSKGSSVRLVRQKTRSRKGGVDSRSTLSAAEGRSAIVGGLVPETGQIGGLIDICRPVSYNVGVTDMGKV
jgi:hypothetical protein